MFSRVNKKLARLLVVALIAPLFAIIGAASAQAVTLTLSNTDALAFPRTSAVVPATGAAAPTTLGKTAGDVVLYKNIIVVGGVAVDAAVTTVAIASGSISDYDNPGSATTVANNFQLNTVGGEVTIKFDFYVAGTYTVPGTGTKVVLQNVKVTSIDLDSSSSAGSYQYSDFNGFQKYSMMSPTNLLVQAKTDTSTTFPTPRVRFIAGLTGSRSTVPQDQVLIKYDAMTSMTVNFGNVVAGSTNYFGLVFGAWPGTGVPVEYSNSYNTPPTSSNTVIYLSNSVANDTLTVSNLGNYADADGNPFNLVRIDSISSGNIKYNGSNISAGALIPIADIEAGKLVFDPTGATTPVTVTFAVQDGLDFSLSTYTITINVTSQNQTITFAKPGDTSTALTFPSGASASSTLPVTLTSNTPGICTVDGSGNIITSTTNTGTCSITATQAGNATYGAAAPVTQEFQVGSGSGSPQTIVPTTPTTKTVGGTFTLIETSTSGLEVKPTSQTPSVCTISATSPFVVTLVGPGTCTIQLTQPGNSSYYPATPKTISFQVNATANGGTIPAVRTAGVAIDTSTFTFSGYVDTNSVNTTYQFCYGRTKYTQNTNGVLVYNSSGSSSSVICTDTSTSVLSGSIVLDYLVNSAALNTNTLSAGKSYYFQAIAWHTSTNKVYGQIFKFTFPDSGSNSSKTPYLKTLNPVSTNTTSAVLKGSIIGRTTATETKFCLSTSMDIKSGTFGGMLCPNPDSLVYTFSGTAATSLPQANISYYETLTATGLSPNTTYYYQEVAFANNTTYYGNIIKFTTSAEPPVATTQKATSVGATTGKLNGSVVANGASTLIYFCYSETATAVTGHTATCTAANGGVSSASGNSATAASLTLSGLTTGHTIYFMTKADRGGTIVYGGLQAFTPGAPTAITSAATNINNSSGWAATLNGYMNPNGINATPYFYLSTDSTTANTGSLVTFDSFTVTNPSETLTVNSAMEYTKSALSPATIYYFQAVGLNKSLGLYSYGEVMSFVTAAAPTVTTTAATSVTALDATLNGILTSNGAITNGYFCLSDANDNTIITGILDTCIQYVPSSPTSASSLASGQVISGAVSGLNFGTTYFFQAVGENAMGTVYGEILDFTTLAGPPVANTDPATNILNSGATLNGTVDPSGASTVVTFCYKQSGSSPSTTGGKIDACTSTPVVATVAGNSAIIDESYDLSGLTAGLTYWYQIVESNTAGIAYGNLVSFVVGSPTVRTTAPTGLTSSSAVLNGTVANNGSSISSGVSFYLTDVSGAIDPTTGALTGTSVTTGSASRTSITSSDTSTVNESSTATSLISSTTYYYQIIAQNGRGTSYGNVITFTLGAPIGTTNAASSVSSTSATINGSIDPNGDAGTTGGFCVSTSASVDDVGALTTCVNSPSVTGPFTSGTNIPVSITGLTSGRTYYFQIWASGTNGTTYGAVRNFATGRFVTFDPNGGSGSMNSQTANGPTNLTSNSLTRACFTFAGWATSPNGSVVYADGASFPFTINTTLYAKWTAASCGGGGSAPAPTPEVKKEEPKVEKPVVVEPVKKEPVKLVFNSGQIKTEAEKKKVIVNQVVPVKQTIQLEVPPTVKIVQVLINGKTTSATVTEDGKIDLGKNLVGPKDKVSVVAVTDGQQQTVPVQVKNDPISIGNVNFDFASSKLTLEAKKILTNIAKVVKSHGFTTIDLSGHADVFTSAGFDNQLLSEQRNAAVRAYLKKLIPGGVKIILDAFAAKEPIVAKTTAAARALNRRVEIIVQ